MAAPLTGRYGVVPDAVVGDITTGKAGNNASSVPATTTVWLHKTDLDGTNTGEAIYNAALAVGNPTKGVLRLRRIGTGQASSITLTVTAVAVAAANVYAFTVDELAYDTDFLGTVFWVGFEPSGAQGATGSTGATGPAGGAGGAGATGPTGPSVTADSLNIGVTSATSANVAANGGAGSQTVSCGGGKTIIGCHCATTAAQHRIRANTITTPGANGTCTCLSRNDQGSGDPLTAQAVCLG